MYGSSIFPKTHSAVVEYNRFTHEISFLLSAILAFSLPAAHGQNCLIQADDVACIGSTQTYTLSGVDPAAATISWSVSGGGAQVLTSNSQNITVQWSSVGAATLTAALADASGASLGSCTANVAVGVIPTPSIRLPDNSCGFKEVFAACGENPYLLEVNGEPGSSFDWTVTGTGVSAPMTGPGTTFEVDLLSEGNLEVCVTETAVNGCESTTVCREVTVFPPPLISVSEVFHGNAAQITVCSGQELNFVGTFLDPSDLPLEY